MKIKLINVRFLFEKRLAKTIMKTFIFLMCTMAFCFTPNNSFSQEKVIIEKNQLLTIDKVFKIIKKQTNFDFIYPRRLFKNSPKIALKKGEIIVSKLLEQCFSTNDFSFEFAEDNTILIVEKPAIKEVKEVQQIEISGIVTDNSGIPLPGANILEKGTTNGTQTDFDGNFSLMVSDENAILVVSFIGFTSKEITVGEETNFNIAISEDASQLDEVVVIGYGTVRKSDLTGSVSSLKADEINVGSNVSVDQMMQGRAAGVQISQSSSEPGGGMSVRIRGASSINASNEPLYVIDGLPIDNSSGISASGLGVSGFESSAKTAINLVPKNPLNSLNPNDIESIEILKDASATAIYGSRGANGVVLITTKKGDKDKITLNYSGYTGIQNISNKIDVLSTDEYINFINAISDELGETAPFDPAAIASIGKGTNWQNEIYRSAKITEQNISVSGGLGGSNIYASLNYFDQEGIVKNTGIKKYIGRINFNSQLSDKTALGFNINTSFIDDSNTFDGLSVNLEAGAIYGSLLMDPTEQIYNADGSFSVSPNLNINNPLGIIEGITTKSEANRTLANFFITHDILEGLQAKLNFGSDRQNQRRDVYNSTLTQRGAPAGGIADVTQFERSSYLGEFTLDYSKELNENHRINLLGGITYQKFNSKLLSANISGFPTDNVLTNALALGDTNNDNLFSLKEENTLLSYLARVNYTLLDKFLITGSIRADGSSRFGLNNKYGYFPSFAFGYKLTEEAFVPEVFSELKLRASWGQTGNQEIGNYASQLTFGSGGLVVFGNTVYGSTEPKRIPNSDLKWETTTQINLGLDFGLLNNRITGTIDYFKKNTTDLLFNLPLPSASGYSSILSNIGEVENSGIEFMVNSVNVSTPDFSWNTSLNLSSTRNNVLDLGSVDQIETGNVEFVGETSIVKVGSPIASYYGYEVDGIQQSGDVNPGFPNFVDQNGDGVINSDDRTIIGNPSPDFIYGINNSFQYKNFGLNFFIQGTEGGDLLNINLIESLYPANLRRNRLSDMALDRWTPSNTDAKWPSQSDSSSYPGGKVNTMVLQDASFLRLKNVTINYQVPVENSSIFSALSVYVTGQNLLTFTNYIGFDPEANSFGRSNIKIDYSSYPLASTILLGLTAKF